MSSPIKRRQNLHYKLRDNESHIHLLEEQIRATQKLATLGTMACLVAHEFNNILTPMINYADLALKHQDDLDLMRKALEKTIKHGQRAALIIQSMLGLVRDQNQECQEVKVNEAVDECFQCLARDFSKDRITIKRDIPSDLTVFMVPGQFLQVLLNLIINARQAMLGRSGTLTIRGQRKGDRVLVDIIDTGCGIEPEILESIFKPFFTTKNDTQAGQQGTGLGLSICKDIVEGHQGSIRVESLPGQGATFTLDLPAEPVGLNAPSEGLPCEE